MKSFARASSSVRWGALVALLLAAFGLRILLIDRQSIWYDEGLSIYYAQRPLPEMLSQVSSSDHPPLHTLLLHAWIRFCGDSELSVRLFSAWWGVLCIPLLYALARRVSPPTGLLAALLLAISPFAVWYAQEARGYTLALALSLAAVEVGLRLLDPRSRASWVHYGAYVGLATGALYSHFYTGFVLLGLNVVLIGDGILALHRRSRAWGRLARWTLAQLAVIALLGPWVPFVLRQIAENATYWHGAVGWQQILGQTLAAFAVGETLSGGWAVAAAVLVGAFALLGTVVLAWRREDRLFLALLWSWMLVPAFFVIAINLAHPKFSPRYLLNALPPYLVLAAVGTRSLWTFARRHLSTAWGGSAVALLLLSSSVLGGATARSLAGYYLDQDLYRPDFRAVADYISTHASPDDLIVLVGGHSYPAFAYYYRGPLPVIAMPGKLLPTTREPLDLRALGSLNEAIAGHRQLWLVLWQAELADPTGLVVDALEQTYHRLGVERAFHEIGLLAFDVSPGPLLADVLEPQVAMTADFGDQVRFLGYDLPVATARPGETLYLYLYWQALPQVAHDYKVFAQVLDGQDRIVAQQDAVAGAEAYPTSHWLPGHVIRDRLLLTVSSDAAPGPHRLIVGLYSPGRDKARLPVEGDGAQGDYVLLAEIEIR
ncbi:MAG: glycosyltransferase family 39 protein [Anaerolineae bacterium]